MQSRIAIAFLVLAPLVANEAAAQSGEQDTVEFRSVISANPLLLMFSWFNAEFEHWASPTSTWGVRGSTLSFGEDDGNDDESYFSGRAFYRYYPSGAFRSFFFGVDAGVTGVDDSGDSHTVFGAGIELGVNWLLGSNRKFYVSLGAGVDRLFGEGLDDASTAIPTLRIVNVGFGF